MRFSILSLFALSACDVPQIELESTNGDFDGSDDDLMEQGDTGANFEGSDGSEGSDSSDGTTATVVSGTWDVATASLIDDPCEWDAALLQFFGLGTDALLPSDFTVSGGSNGFEIEANSYGAAGPIRCDINGSSFACETQSVTPIDYDLGTYGWTYAIVFTGTLFDETSLDGTAVVTFPTISEYVQQGLEYVGVDASQCSQTYALSLEAGF